MRDQRGTRQDVLLSKETENKLLREVFVHAAYMIEHSVPVDALRYMTDGHLCDLHKAVLAVREYEDE